MLDKKRYFSLKSRPSKQGGFDIVIGNPPYIKEYTNKKAFDGFREMSKYYMGKMDIWYGFACEAVDLLNETGFICFIATNNWTTNTGASILRNKIISDTKIEQIIDFGKYMIFEDSASIQTMIMICQKNILTDNYKFDYRRLTKDKAKREDAIAILNNSQTDAIYLSPNINRAYRKNELLTFTDDATELLLEKINFESMRLTNKDIAQGIVFPQDFLNAKGHKILPEIQIGSGVFGLTNDELLKLDLPDKEKDLIRPYYTTEQIHRYNTDRNNKLWLIYTDSSFKNLHSMDIYPVLKSHLNKFMPVLTSDNKPYGLHRARNKKFFQGDKIVSLRKCSVRPTFSFSDFDVYVTQTFFVIQTSRFDLKFLTGLFNSKLVEFWLRHKGKMQGDNFQIDKEPLMQIPIKIAYDIDSKISTVVSSILSAKEANQNIDICREEKQINILVYHLYNLTYEEILIIDPQTSISREEYFTQK